MMIFNKKPFAYDYLYSCMKLSLNFTRVWSIFIENKNKLVSVKYYLHIIIMPTKRYFNTIRVFKPELRGSLHSWNLFRSLRSVFFVIGYNIT